MKTLGPPGLVFFALVSFCLNLKAQAASWTNSATGEVYTNYISDKAGNITNPDYLAPFTLRTTTGTVISNAVATKLLSNKLIYETPSGGGTVRMDALEPDLQKRFRYDPARASMADSLDAVKKAVDDLEQTEDKIEGAENARRTAAYQMAMQRQATFYGDVMQKIDNGLLVRTPGSYGYEVGDPQSTILLKHYPLEDSVASDDQIHATAFPIGNYSYTTVTGAGNTVHVWTCDTNEAIQYYLTH